MADINVAKPFTLTLDDRSVIEFKKGKNTVADDVAAHWYVKAHLVDAKPLPAPGSVAALKAAGEAAAKAARAEAEKDAETDAAARAKVQVDAQAALAARTRNAIEKQAAAALRAANQPAKSSK